jgi:hypothetical protein
MGQPIKGTISNIIFIKGTGKGNRAAYQVGTERVPAAVITRLLSAVEGVSGFPLDRHFYLGLKRYPAFMDELDAQDISPAIAIADLQKLQEGTSALYSSNPINASGARNEAEMENIIEMLTGVKVRHYVKSNPRTHLRYGADPECVHHFPALQRGPQKHKVIPDQTMWVPALRHTYFVEDRTQTVGGSVDAKIYKLPSQYLKNGDMSKDQTLVLVADAPGIPDYEKEAIEREFRDAGALAGRNYLLFWSKVDFAKAFSKPMSEWPKTQGE